MEPTPLNDTGDAAHGDVAELENRKSGRIRLEDLRCNLGDIVNISAGGLRILAKRRPPQRTVIRIAGSDSMISVPVELAWAKRHGWRSWELGLQFATHDPAIRAVLNYICRDNRYVPTF